LNRDLPNLSHVSDTVRSARYDEPPGNLPPFPIATETIPPILFDAVVAIEDRRFYQHGGVDWVGIARAAVSNLEAREVVEGGSTITQQLAKNLYLTPEQSWQRKLREAVLATKLESILTKREILAYYLNRVYFGSGAYGIGAAAAVYFDKPIDDLDLAEVALLAGILQAPSLYSPHNNPTLAQKRRDLVLQVMADAGVISKADAATAIATPISIVPLRPIQGRPLEGAIVPGG
jgi:penicillin-binding protein 1A